MGGGVKGRRWRVERRRSERVEEGVEVVEGFEGGGVEGWRGRGDGEMEG